MKIKLYMDVPCAMICVFVEMRWRCVRVGWDGGQGRENISKKHTEKRKNTNIVTDLGIIRTNGYISTIVSTNRGSPG